MPTFERGSSRRIPAVVAKIEADMIRTDPRSRTNSPTESQAPHTILTAKSRSPAPVRAGTKRKGRELDDDTGYETNIKVVVRCRGRNEREIRESSGVVVSTAGLQGETLELSMGPNALANKTYCFDGVFAPAADQRMIYDEVVTPMLGEIVAGYNCTIFAYGQTGTGKTYTMSGDMSDTLGMLAESAGIIPRALYALFDKLEAEDCESTVKCSFLELYNEELHDLLAAEETSKLKIFEDANKKGQIGTHVQGMEEHFIRCPADGIKLLQAGSHKRQVAATKCNDLSSRSHTVFTVTVHIKRVGLNGKDYVSAGKLNLVDLAGSENIQRSGAENKRAAEAGVINKSLLTLGRVINALVERSSHIPYRESKLTRLLQDSLGGRTTTCIVATVSPAKSSLDETISTLEYAFRAKNIRNKPQLNPVVSKQTLLREFTSEIEKLKSELAAARQRNGVYLAKESYEQLVSENESRRLLNDELTAKIDLTEINFQNKARELFQITEKWNVQKKDMETLRRRLNETTELLDHTEGLLRRTKKSLREEIVIREAHAQTESQLHDVGDVLLGTLQETVTDITDLHGKVNQATTAYKWNRATIESAQVEVSDVTQTIQTRFREAELQQRLAVSALSTRIAYLLQAEVDTAEEAKSRINSQQRHHRERLDQISEDAYNSKEETTAIYTCIGEDQQKVKDGVERSLEGLTFTVASIIAGVNDELRRFETRFRKSYDSLGEHVDLVSSQLTSHLESHRQEVQGLRQCLRDITTVAKDRGGSCNSGIDMILAEERQQAIVDRQNLLSTIQTLVNASAQEQDERLASRLGDLKDQITTSTDTLEMTANAQQDQSDGWADKEAEEIEEMENTRLSLGDKLRQHRMLDHDRDLLIQTETNKVKEVAARVVNDVLLHVDQGTKVLDRVMTRGQAVAHEQYDKSNESRQELADWVQGALKAAHDHIDSTRGRMLENFKGAQASAIELSTPLPTLATETHSSLERLRNHVVSLSLKKIDRVEEDFGIKPYRYPAILPRTDPRENLIAASTEERAPTEGVYPHHDDPPTRSSSRGPTALADRDQPRPWVENESVGQEDEADRNITVPSSGLRQVDPNKRLNSLGGDAGLDIQPRSPKRRKTGAHAAVEVVNAGASVIHIKAAPVVSIKDEPDHVVIRKAGGHARRKRKQSS